MTSPELFETGEIDDDSDHWDALAARVATVAARTSRQGGFAWLANSRTGWIAATLLIATVLALMMLPIGSSAEADDRAVWTELVAPSDDVGQAIVVRDGPPPIGALLLNS